MSVCEKCWADAYTVALTTGEHQSQAYTRLLRERDEKGQACTPAQQRGEVAHPKRRVTDQ